MPAIIEILDLSIGETFFINTKIKYEDYIIYRPGFENDSWTNYERRRREQGVKNFIESSGPEYNYYSRLDFKDNWEGFTREWVYFLFSIGKLPHYVDIISETELVEEEIINIKQPKINIKQSKIMDRVYYSLFVKLVNFISKHSK